MRAKKFGGATWCRNSLLTKNLFYNPRKNMSLIEVREYFNCKCVGKFWRVETYVLEGVFMKPKMILETEIYSVAWDKVKDDFFQKVR